LAHNYDPNPGDEIFFVGFSRGAYTARSIAGLVTNLGLLTKRGMDYFPEVYEEYYRDPKSNPNFTFSKGLLDKIGKDVNEGAKDAVKVVAVWDTVEFHEEGAIGEKIEFHNAELSKRIPYAYHALALDERRIPFIPTLWQWPKDYQITEGKGLQIMKQVWFSGAHSDVGGGKYDPGCSDVSLAWMLAQCSKDKKLAFTDEDPENPNDPNEYYLLPSRLQPNTNEKWTQLAHQPDVDPLDTFWDQSWTIIEGLTSEDRRAFLMERTKERIHRSINSRDLKAWPCGVLSGKNPDGSWGLKIPSKYGNALVELESDPVADKIEDKYRGRIRPPPGSKGADP